MFSESNQTKTDGPPDLLTNDAIVINTETNRWEGLWHVIVSASKCFTLFFYYKRQKRHTFPWLIRFFFFFFYSLYTSGLIWKSAPQTSWFMLATKQAAANWLKLWKPRFIFRLTRNGKRCSVLISITALFLPPLLPPALSMQREEEEMTDETAEDTQRWREMTSCS